MSTSKTQTTATTAITADTITTTAAAAAAATISPLRVLVTMDTPMAKDYIYIPTHDLGITIRCQILTLMAGRVLYTVVDDVDSKLPVTPRGIGVPQDIAQRVMHQRMGALALSLVKENNEANEPIVDPTEFPHPPEWWGNDDNDIIGGDYQHPPEWYQTGSFDWGDNNGDNSGIVAEYQHSPEWYYHDSGVY
ncbi:hypothetical protein CIB48_g54 [Xylaria polymorpha]|nr:hypothetical protein CIB48_g54 [Xylaria polymorpha]